MSGETGSTTRGRRAFGLRLRTTALAVVLASTSFAVAAIPHPAPSGTDPLSAVVGQIGQLVAPKPVRAAFCASNAAFSGRLTASSASTVAVGPITNGTVYGYISNVDAAWSCTAYLRYSGVAWNTTTTAGRFNWGMELTHFRGR